MHVFTTYSCPPVKACKRLVLAGLLLVAGCSTQVYGFFGEEDEVFTGQMITGADNSGHIELDNGKGTQCAGEHVAYRPGLDSGSLLGVVVAVSAGATGHVLLTCNDGQRVAIQFHSVSLDSGYGFGTTNQGRPVKFTYGMSRAESARYFKIGQTSTASGSGAGSGQASPREATGTGFYITRQGHGLTNAHVVDGCKTLTVARVGEMATGANVVSIDKQNDLAVLLAASAAPAVASLRARPVRQGDPVVAFGFPYAGSLSSGGAITTGSISALSGLRDDTRYLQISTPVQPGNSGGPLLDDSAAVVGVVSSGLRASRTTGIVPQNVNFAIKADVVRTFLSAAGVIPENAAGGHQLSTPDVGERARSFSVLIDCKG